MQFQHFRDAEAFLNGDYGSDDAWASLKGNCFEMDESQYTYRLCLFDKAIQKERNGAIEINLGYTFIKFFSFGNFAPDVERFVYPEIGRPGHLNFESIEELDL